MKTKTLTCLLLLPLMLSAVCLANFPPDARFADKEHLSALQLYQMGNPARAIKENIGKLVTFDVAITIERDVPLVEIITPQNFTPKESGAPRLIMAHLIGVRTEAASLKKGDKVKIEGLIVNEGYGAYTIYVYRVLEKQKGDVN